MRKLILLLSLGALVWWASWYGKQHWAHISKAAENYFPTATFHTWEIRHSAEEILNMHKTQLVKNAGYTLLEPKLLFYPYLMMDIKYTTSSGDTSEGHLLWGLNDGEMILRTATWEKTHGFEDCLAAGADKHDFKIIEALVNNGGCMEQEKLYSLFHADQDLIDKWLDKCREKKLITMFGNKLRLHLQNPLLKMEPFTILDAPFVTHQHVKYAHKISGKYSSFQIKKLAQVAFGQDFAIRTTQEIYLPVYAISIQNPDGSVLTTYWNALNGKQFNETGKLL